MQKRSALLPYIYTAVREAFDTGISLLRPMYYDYPTYQNAYLASPTAFGQYMFGPNILVSPIVTPMDPTSLMSATKIWLPPGTWFDTTSGSMITSDGVSASSILSKAYDLTEIPAFVPAGGEISYLCVWCSIQSAYMSQPSCL